VGEPVLVTAGVPIGEVAGGDVVRERRVGGLLELAGDFVVGKAVGEVLVDELALVFGEAGDFTRTTLFEWGVSIHF
jgi:hypothetical protein